MIDTINLVKRLREIATHCRAAEAGAWAGGAKLTMTTRITDDGIVITAAFTGDETTVREQMIVAWATLTNAVVSPGPSIVSDVAMRVMRAAKEVPNAAGQ